MSTHGYTIRVVGIATTSIQIKTIEWKRNAMRLETGVDVVEVIIED